jgi:hypothetical protein
MRFINGKIARLSILASAIIIAALFAWVAWPSDPGISPLDQSREDGKSRFWASSYPKTGGASNASLSARIFLLWMDLQRRYGKPNPASYSFPASPVALCSVGGLLNQCMEVSGTQYLIGVEAAGAAIEFGNTNVLTGAQWVAAFETAIEKSEPVMCYDYAKKRSFHDTLLLIREKPRLVKIIPRSKLSDYQKADLVKRDS